MGKRRPSIEVHSVVLYNDKDSDGNWIPQNCNIGSWVMLSSPKRGPWAKDSQREGGLIAQIKSFKFKASSSLIESILVQHAYTFRQLRLAPTTDTFNGGINYIYPSSFQDWQDPRSILDFVVVIHADIGEPIYAHRGHKHCMLDRIYFYNARYLPPLSPSSFGKLVSLPLPHFQDSEWPLPDMLTSECYRAKMFSDFQNCMKPTTGSQVSSLRWMMPIHVMIDLFSVPSLGRSHKTQTLFVFSDMDDSLFNSLMDNGWDEKIVAGADIVKCKVLCKTVTFRYHIGRQTLYARFQYMRHRFVDRKWIQMDQADPDMIVISIDGVGEFRVGRSWNLAHLREEVTFSMSPEVVDSTWAFYIIPSLTNKQQRPKKINTRQEKDFVISQLGDSCCLKVIHAVSATT